MTKAGLLQAVLLFTRALGAVGAMYMMTLATPASEMIGVLKRIHVPKMIVELMYLIYRFIFVFERHHSQMKQAAVSGTEPAIFRTSCRTFGSTAGNLLVASLKGADTYYDSLLSRCYDGGSLFPGGREGGSGEARRQRQRDTTADCGGVDLTVVRHRSDTEKMRERW